MGVVVLVVTAVGCINLSLTRQTSVKSRDFCRAVSSSLINKSLSNSAPLLVLKRFSQRCRRIFANWLFQRLKNPRKVCYHMVIPVNLFTTCF